MQTIDLRGRTLSTAEMLAVVPRATAARAEAALIGDATGLPVETYDERFTTVTAQRSLAEQNVRGQDRRKVIDMVAAAVLLQAWLDRRPQEPQ